VGAELSKIGVVRSYIFSGGYQHFCCYSWTVNYLQNSFSSTNDQVIEAKAKIIESEGSSALVYYFLPKADITLEQGAGRLIRRESDHGVLVDCETHLISMRYGKRLIKA